MLSRLKLHKQFETITGNHNVYFQPPESIKINYPAIIYNLTDIPILRADDIAYKYREAYRVVVIDKNPDSQLYKKVALLQYSSFVTSYSTDGLNHWVFKIFNE